MNSYSNSFARTALCALAGLAFAGFSLTTAVTSVQAAPADSWTQNVNARINAAMHKPAGSARGLVHVKFTVAPDGSISDVAVVGGSRNAALRRAALRTADELGTLPALPGATAPVRVSMVLQFVDQPSDIKKIGASPVQIAGLLR